MEIDMALVLTRVPEAASDSFATLSTIMVRMVKEATMPFSMLTTTGCGSVLGLGVGVTAVSEVEMLPC